MNFFHFRKLEIVFKVDLEVHMFFFSRNVFFRLKNMNVKILSLF